MCLSTAGIDWNAVAAVGGAASAFAALATVVVTKRHWDATQLARAMEKRENYADQWIVRRVHDRIDTFVEGVVPLVRKRLNEASRLYAANGTAGDIDAALEALIADFDDSYHNVRRMILLRVRGLLSVDSENRIIASLDDVQDCFMRALDVPPKKLDEETVIAEIEKSCARLVRTVVKEAVNL